MVTSAEKAKRTRAKNLKLKKNQAEQLRRARASARKAQAELKSYKAGFEDALKYMK